MQKSKKVVTLIFTTIIILIIFGITTRENVRFAWFRNLISIPVYPIQKVFSQSSSKIAGSINFFGDIKDIKKENDELKAKVEALEKENRELVGYRVKNQELTEALNIKAQIDDYNPMGANVLAKDPGNWFNIFRVDRGRYDGIDAGKKDGAYTYYPVINGKGLIGKVDSSDMFSSRVLTIIDVDSVLSCVLTKSLEFGVLKGDMALKEQGLCKLEFNDNDVEVAAGDTVQTSGLGGIFPRGILIGKVKQIRKSNNDLNMYAIIEPAVDFKRIEEVIILINKNKAQMGNVAK